MAAYLQNIIHLFLIDKVLVTRNIYLHLLTGNASLLYFDKAHERNHSAQAYYPGKTYQNIEP
jgi:hypothetical protein